MKWIVTHILSDSCNICDILTFNQFSLVCFFLKKQRKTNKRINFPKLDFMNNFKTIYTHTLNKNKNKNGLAVKIDDAKYICRIVRHDGLKHLKKVKTSELIY